MIDAQLVVQKRLNSFLHMPLYFTSFHGCFPFSSEDVALGFRHPRPHVSRYKFW